MLTKPPGAIDGLGEPYEPETQTRLTRPRVGLILGALERFSITEASG
jgi:hypothetical protein